MLGTRLIVVTAAVVVLLLPPSAATAQCVGDCDSSADVTVDEIVMMVVIGLGEGAIESCVAGDINADESITVDEILTAMSNGLDGCPAAASICGGAVVSEPQVCGLTISPNPVSESGAIAIQVGIADLEGDITTACFGVAPVGSEPILECVSWPATNVMLNQVVQARPSPVETGPGMFTAAFMVEDAGGHVSNLTTTTYEVFADDQEPVLFLFGGPALVAYLGCLSCAESHPESVFNELGTYGSNLSASSIWNNLGFYGDQTSPYSACNPTATEPPVIVDQRNNFYGRLTVNRLHPQIVPNAALIDLLEQTICS